MFIPESQREEIKKQRDKLLKEKALKVKRDTITEMNVIEFIGKCVDKFSYKYNIWIPNGSAVAVVTDIATNKKKYFYDRQTFINWGIKQLSKYENIFNMVI